MGNGFPGLAIVSVIALLAALGLAALISLHPWAADSVSPRLSVAPGLGVALGDSVAVSPGRQLAVAPGRPAAGGAQGFAAAEVAVDEGASRPKLAIGRAQAVTRPRPVHSPEGSAPPSSEPSPMPPPSSAPAVVPVSAPAPEPAPSPEPAAAPPTSVAPAHGSHPPGPSTAGLGEDGDSVSAPIQVRDGDEYAFSFSFYIQPSVYLSPGSENLIMRFKGAVGEPSFGLQLWDDGSGAQRGLWASGDAMGGERFLAPVAEGVWHEAVVCFGASSQGDGFYLLTLDDQPIDARAWVSLIEPGSSSTLIETGLFRGGEPVVGDPGIFFGPARLGETMESVIP